MMVKLKLGPIETKKQVRVSVVMPALLKLELERYAAVYSSTWGTTTTVATLIPHMLETFIKYDVAFKRAQASDGKSRA